MAITPWIGVRRVAIVPVLDRQVDREPPADWEYQVASRVFYDPEPGTGRDRSFAHYLHALSYGRAAIEGEVFPRVWAETAEVNTPAMHSLPPGHGYTSLLAVLPHAAGEHRGGHAFGGLSPVNGITGWARVAMFNNPVMPDRQPIGVWGQELFHLLCNLWEHPALPGWDVMDGGGAMKSVHASATTKRLFGWLPHGILDFEGGVLNANLHALGLLHPPPPDRVSAVRLPSRQAGRRIFVEARLRTDSFDGAVPQEGAIVYTVDGESTVALQAVATAGQTVSVPDEGLQVSVASVQDGAAAVTIRSPIPPLVDRSAQYATPGATGSPTACVIPALGVHDILYRDSSGRLHELWRDAAGRTGTSNITTLGGGPKAAGDPYAYVDTNATLLVLLFRAENGEVHSFYWSTGAVGHDNLSGSVNAPKAAGDPMGWFRPSTNEHHVAYRGGNGHIHVLWWAGQGAVGHEDATALANAPSAAGDPCGFLDPLRGDHIVAYRSGDGHIRTLFWSTGPVGHDDLSGVAGTPAAAGDPIAFYTGHDDNHQVIYRATNGHLYELFWPGAAGVSSWDLTAAAGAPLAASDPAAYYSAATNTKRVIFRSADDRLHEIAWQPGGGAPTHVDVTALVGAPAAKDRPAAFTVEATGTQHIAFRGANGHIFEVRR